MSERLGADRCPGLLRPHVADDGALVRLRIPGGRVRVSTLAELLSIATEHGSAVLQLTSRGNIQMRALPNPLPEMAIARIEATGLVPSASHERVRNILAAPLARELDPLIDELDRAIIADPGLAALPGRFLFAIADATDSVLDEPFDVGFQALTPDEGLLLCGEFGRTVATSFAVAEMVELARAFLACRPSDRVWNVQDLPVDSPTFEGMSRLVPRASTVPAIGVHGADVVVGVPLGLLRERHVSAIARVTNDVVITPWRTIVLRDAAAHTDALAESELVLSQTSPWAELSACIGAPGCARSATSTLDVAEQVADLCPTGVRRLHIVGCERGCGCPAQDHVLVVGACDGVEALVLAGLSA